MATPRGSFSRPFNVVEPSRTAKDPVLAVGWRAVVRATPDSAGRVTLTDEEGMTALHTVADRAEVEIMAWRPRRSGPALYRVRTTRGGKEGGKESGKEGWVSAANLERLPVSPPPKPPAKPAPSASPGPKRAATKAVKGSRKGSSAR